MLGCDVFIKRSITLQFKIRYLMIDLIKLYYFNLKLKTSDFIEIDSSLVMTDQ